MVCCNLAGIAFFNSAQSLPLSQTETEFAQHKVGIAGSFASLQLKMSFKSEFPNLSDFADRRGSGEGAEEGMVPCERLASVYTCVCLLLVQWGYPHVDSRVLA